MEKSLKSLEIILDECDADLDSCIFVLFSFHEKTRHKFKVKNLKYEVSSVKGYICNVFVHISVFEIIILY